MNGERVVVVVRPPMPFARLLREIRKLRDPRAALVLLALGSILAVGGVARWHFAVQLDPFEDGYQHWWISANLLETGEYWDRHSMMTQGNWLPLYHFFSAGVLAASGVHNVVAMKAANVLLSSLTAILVFLLARKEGDGVALLAAGLFAFNLIDVVVSGWSTAESLAAFLLVLGYGLLFVWRLPRKAHVVAGAAAFALAVMTRYEIWLLVTLLVTFLLIRDVRPARSLRPLFVVVPAVTFMVAYFAYALRWGFLPEIIVRQTSTDIAFQLAAGTQPSVASILGQWWVGYILFFPLVFLFGGGYALYRVRKEFASWIIVSLWGFVVVYSALRFGNPSYRYVMFSVPFLSVMAACGWKRLASVLSGWHVVPRLRLDGKRIFAAGAILLVASTAFTVGDYSDAEFPSRAFMVPLRRAGEFLSAQPLPPGKLLISESPIAAYYSGYPPDRILGSRWLPDNRTEATDFLKQHVAYVVYMGVPYYPMRNLFPELQSGETTIDFEFMFDAGGRELATHAVFVYRVIPG